MRSLRIAGETRRLAENQSEYQALSILDMPCPVTHGDGKVEQVNMMVSAWEPTPAELAKLCAGGPIFLGILGERFPPVSIWVGDPPPMVEGEKS